MRSHVRHLVVALALAGGAGCTASASLNVSTPPTRGSAEPSIARASVTIVRHGDKLDYENGEIEFETGSAALVGGGTDDILDRYAAVLKQYPELKIRVEGHTDSRGSTKSNQELSDLRAKSIRNALIRRGVASERLDARGFGESQPERVEPAGCRNRSEDTVADDKLAECKEIWTANRRAGFIVTEGGGSLPADGTVADAPEPAPVSSGSPGKKHPDWALRMFGGYSLRYPGDGFHGGHFGIGVHASQRFGARQRGYIGGGPRLHYRGVRGRETGLAGYDFATHYIGPEGNLLVGGGNDRIVGLFSLRLGLGVGITHGSASGVGFAGWMLGGPMVLGKINERWSLGGHAEFGLIGGVGAVAFATEIGLNVAWHFGRGRRKGL